MTQLPNHEQMVTEEPPAQQLSLGERLRALREARNLDINMVAAELHLSLATVQAMEQNRFETLPDPVFVRGYLRTYARLLGTEPEPLVNAYRELGYRDPPEIRVVPAHRRKDVQRRRMLGVTVMSVGLMTGIALLGWGIYTYYPTLFGNGGGSGEVPQEVAATVLSEDVLPVRQPKPVSENKMERVPSMTTQPSWELADPGPLVQEPSPMMPVAEEPMSDTLAKITDKPLRVPAGSDGSEETPVLSGTTEPSEASIETDQSRLVLTFSEDSWVQVYDANRVRKLLGIMKADTQRTVMGEAPFSVTLGNSEGVEVTINGERFDQGPHVRGNVARFEIGQAPD